LLVYFCVSPVKKKRYDSELSLPTGYALQGALGSR